MYNAVLFNLCKSATELCARKGYEMTLEGDLLHLQKRKRYVNQENTKIEGNLKAYNNPRTLYRHPGAIKTTLRRKGVLRLLRVASILSRNQWNQNFDACFPNGPFTRQPSLFSIIHRIFCWYRAWFSYPFTYNSVVLPVWDYLQLEWSSRPFKLIKSWWLNDNLENTKAHSVLAQVGCFLEGTLELTTSMKARFQM